MIGRMMQTRLALALVYFAALVVFSIAVPDEHLVWLGTAVLLVMLVPANYFPIFYTLAFRWWDGHLGRALFTKALGLAVVLNTALLFRFFGQQAWAEEVRFVAYVLVLTGMTYQCGVMTAIRFSPKREILPNDTQPPADLRGIDRH